MKPLLKRYSIERLEGERFGDFCIRIGMIKPTTEGKLFHDDVSAIVPLFAFHSPPIFHKLNSS
jgi:sulfite reductase (NADPH) hemoprotein beta-component